MTTAATGRPVLLQAALTGDRRPGEHPRLPVTALDVARDAAAVHAAGAGGVHVHPKGPLGGDSVAARDVAVVVAAVRAAVPGLPISVTTGAWAEPDPTARARAVAAWGWESARNRPDVASVNWHEDGAGDVADALLAAGVGIEAGLFHLEAVEAWTRWPRFRAGCVRILLELPGDLPEARTPGVAGDMLAAVRQTGCTSPVLVHGEGSSCWPALRWAGRHGLDARIGLEDTLELPDGTLAPGNAALVETACGILSAWGPAPG